MSYSIVIKGGYGLTNFGDDALLYVLAKKLQPLVKSEELAFACYSNEYNSSLVESFNIEDVSEFELIETKLLVYGGGTQFYSFKKRPHIIRKILSICKQLLFNPKKIILGLSENTKKDTKYDYLAAFGIGVGPFINDYKNIIENKAASKFREMSFTSVRDTFSYLKCQEWKINNATMNADICYLLDSPTIKEYKKSVEKIGIVVRDWNHTTEGQSYYSKIKKLTDIIESNGYEVTLILFAVESDNYWNSEKLNYKNILEWNPFEMSIESFTEKLSEYDLFITARFHGAVFATLLGKPFISIVVEQKLELVANLFEHGSEKWSFPFRIDECLEKIEKIDRDYKVYIDAIKVETINQQTLAKNMFSDFIEFCNENNIIDGK